VPSAPFVVPPLLLAVLLVVSAVAKLRDPRDTRSVFDKLRLPRFLTTLEAPRLLPYGELVLAALLVLLPGVWYLLAATLTLILFAAYLVIVVRALGFGYSLLCGCFGQLGLGWITRRTAIRNAVLVAVALVTWLDAWRGEGVLDRLLNAGDAGEAGWWLAGVLVAVVTTVMVVREGDMPPYVPPPVDDDDFPTIPVPYVLLDGPRGPRSVWQLTDDAARLLVFWNPVDEATAAVADRLPVWQRELGPVRVHLVTRSEWGQAVAVRPDLADELLGDPDGHTRERLGAAMPGAVLLGTDRFVAGGPVAGLDEIEVLVAAAAAEIRSSGVADPEGITAQ
jgi:hypothetical protein